MKEMFLIPRETDETEKRRGETKEGNCDEKKINGDRGVWMRMRMRGET